MIPLQKVYLVRHGETAWAMAGKHTGRTDIPLTAEGEAQAVELGARLRKIEVSRVWSSPSMRARRTGELAGFGERAVVDGDLAEWDYGQYEGMTSPEIRAVNPAWNLFRDGSAAESVGQISARADRVIGRLREAGGDVLVFSSGHFIRVLAARWVGLPAAAGAVLACSTASLSVLSYEHDLSDPLLKLWNEVGE